MIKIGSLYKRTCAVTNDQMLCQIVDLFDKRDIDFDCPESVAIVPVVKAVWLNGNNIGHVFTSARRNFRHAWEVINES